MKRTSCVTICIGWTLAISIIGSAEVSPAEDRQRFGEALASISGERMLADVVALSGPEFNGRQTGSKDDLESARFVAERYGSLGLLLSGVSADRFNSMEERPTGFMTRPVTATVVAADATLQLSAPAGGLSPRLGSDFLPIFDSPTADVSAPILFVGYGISDSSEGFDEYADVDVANTIVLFLRGQPDHYKKPISHADKERIAREKGAVAYLTATGPILNSYEARRGVTGTPSALYGLSENEQAIPGAWISTELAERILSRGDEMHRGRLRRLQEQLNGAPTSQSTKTGMSGRLRWESRKEPGVLVNVPASIPGKDPALRAETIIIGAHRDHFGKQAGLLFAGADDNASGTAVLLEVARVLTRSGLRPKSSILFISFSGEEQGLLGSRLYLERAIVPLASTKAMINVDHAGVGNGRLTVGVTGLEKNVAIEAGQAAGLADKLDLFGFFPGGDHVPFKEAGVPTVTVVSGGVHPHFHQPSDTADTVNPEILKTTARYVLALVWQLANAP